jgi:predicted nucleotidyltransferase
MSTNMSKRAKLVEARSTLKVSEERLAKFCHEHHIRRLAVEADRRRERNGRWPSEFLVEFERGRPVGYFELIAAELELSRLLRRKVELITPGSLPTNQRTKILKEATDLYLAA